jgi:hypothetical protein
MQHSDAPPPRAEVANPVRAPDPARRKSLYFWRVVRDMVMVVLMSILGPVVLVVLAHPTRGDVIIGITNLLSGVIAFAISGYFAPGRRWHHLAYVAGGLCVLAFIKIGIVQQDISGWLHAAAGIIFMTAMGGLVSYLFRRHEPPLA